MYALHVDLLWLIAFISGDLAIDLLVMLIDLLLLLNLLEGLLVLPDLVLNIMVLLLVVVSPFNEEMQALNVLGIVALFTTDFLFCSELFNQCVDQALLVADEWLWLSLHR